MSNLTLARFVRPIDSWNRGVTSENILPTRKHFRKYCFPAIGGESEGHSPEAGSRGWPLVTAKRAPSPSAEGWREVRREDQNASQCMVPFLSPRIRRPRRPGHAVLELEPAR
jgi:hypothetical protein